MHIILGHGVTIMLDHNIFQHLYYLLVQLKLLNKMQRYTLSDILNVEIWLVCNPKGSITFRVCFLCRKQSNFTRFVRYRIRSLTAASLKHIVNNNLVSAGSGILLRFLINLNSADEHSQQFRGYR